MERGQPFDRQILTLTQEFNLPALNHYTFLQVGHYLQKNKEWENISREVSNTEQHFMRCEEKLKKGIIFFLQSIEDLKNKDLDCKKRNRMNLACLVINKHKKSELVGILELQPYGKSSVLCWRGCGHQGDLSHILWACPNLHVNSFSITCMFSSKILIISTLSHYRSWK